MWKPLGFALLSALLVSALPVKGQEASKLDLYEGYDYVRYQADPRVSGVPPSESFNANGVSGQIAYNPTDWSGLIR